MTTTTPAPASGTLPAPASAPAPARTASGAPRPRAAAGHAARSTCHRCPPGGGTVVARFPGQGPSRRSRERADEEALRTGSSHHDHYDPELDAFLVIRHD